MEDLTDRQQAVLDYLRQHIAQSGSAPTLTEIASAFGLASVNGVVKHLQALADKGHVELLPNKSRGIRLLGIKGRASNTIELPLVGRVAAGLPILAGDHIERTIAVDHSLFRPRPRYLLRVQGQSMVEAGILDGDLIGIHPTPAAEHGQIVVARLGDEGITVKRLHRQGGTLRLLPCNPTFAPIDPDPVEDFAVEGLYCGLIRTL
jgi:repressor LexA